MARQSEKPFSKIMLTQGKLDMFVQFGDRALQGQTPQEFAAEVQECFRYLMSFRNMINAMVGFDEKPEDAVKPYIDEAEREDA